MDFNVKLKKAVLNVEENNTEKSNSYEKEDAKVNKSSEGLILVRPQIPPGRHYILTTIYTMRALIKFINDRGSLI